jgi:hypothetical protein
MREFFLFYVGHVVALESKSRAHEESVNVLCGAYLRVPPCDSVPTKFREIPSVGSKVVVHADVRTGVALRFYGVNVES